MDDPRDAEERQLSLLSMPATDLPEALADALASLRVGDRAVDALVYLRCPHCTLRKTLLVPRAARVESRLERHLPPVPVRHWVFSLGESAQPRLTAQPRLRTRVARACVAAVFGSLRRAAAGEGLRAPVRCGAVTAVHRVGAALEANVHVHSLVLDGVYAIERERAVFHPLPAPRRRELRRMLAELHHTLQGLLARAPSSPPSARSRERTVHRVAAGPVVRPVLDSTHAPADALVQRHGELDVRAGPIVPADDHALRARLCRYVARAPFDPSALTPGSRGRLRYRLHHPFADGTTHVELSPGVLAERLHALAAGELRPPVAFHGVLAAEAAAAAARASGRQLALLDLPPRGPRTRSRAPSLRCPRCHRTMDIVGVEPALSLRAA